MRHQVLGEKLIATVTATPQQAGGTGVEHDDGAVGRDHRIIGIVVGLHAAAGDADQDRHIVGQITDEDVAISVAIAGHQIGGGTFKGDQGAIP